MNLPFLRRKAEPMPMTLADEAIGVLGKFDIVKMENIAALRDYRKSLHAHAKRTLNALALVDTFLSREDGNHAQAAIEQALEGIELDLSPSKQDKRKKVREVAA